MIRTHLSARDDGFGNGPVLVVLDLAQPDRPVPNILA